MDHPDVRETIVISACMLQMDDIPRFDIHPIMSDNVFLFNNCVIAVVEF